MSAMHENKNTLWHALLKKFWGYDNFRGEQLSVIQSIAQARCDTLAVMPTGAGKSLCYQLPAIASEGVCVVISPLVALMQDQVRALQKRGVAAERISADTHAQDSEQIMARARNRQLKLLYLSPERVSNIAFLTRLAELPVSLIAVDEAHCIVQWGFDFRPAYKSLKNLRTYFAGIPMLALSATATDYTRREIIRALQLHEPKVFIGDFRRINLSYHVFETDDTLEKIAHVLRGVLTRHDTGSAIIYCTRRAQTEEIARALKNKYQLDALFYHAGLDAAERKHVQNTWTRGEVKIVVCTNAFGMGIDKADVRVVIHASPPDSLENYYQEAGRAGRDNHRAYAVLLYEKKNINYLRSQARKAVPDAGELDEVFRLLCDFLHARVEDPLPQQYPFQRNYFLDRHFTSSHTLHASIGILEDLGFITITPALVKVVRVRCLLSRSEIEQAISGQPQLENTAEDLLRNYPFIMRESVFVQPESVARRTREHIHDTIHKLHRLQLYGVISCAWQNAHSDLLSLQIAPYEKVSTLLPKNYLRDLQKLFTERSEQMSAYLTNRKICRSYLLDRYFIDCAPYECGVCDVCVKRKK